MSQPKKIKEQYYKATKSDPKLRELSNMFESLPWYDLGDTLTKISAYGQWSLKVTQRDDGILVVIKKRVPVDPMTIFEKHYQEGDPLLQTGG